MKVLIFADEYFSTEENLLRAKIFSAGAYVGINAEQAPKYMYVKIDSLEQGKV